MFTQEEINNLKVLITTGAKTISSQEPLDKSVVIQNTALQLINKIEGMIEETTPEKQTETE